MQDDTTKRSFRKPNLETARGGSSSAPFISVRSDRSTIGISEQVRRALDVEVGQHLHLALDRTGRSWVAVLDQRTDQHEPEIRGGDPGLVVGSQLMSRHLLNTLDEVPDEAIRFYLTGETAVDPETEATLYQLSSDKSDATSYMDLNE